MGGRMTTTLYYLYKFDKESIGKVIFVDHIEEIYENALVGVEAIHISPNIREINPPKFSLADDASFSINATTKQGIDLALIFSELLSEKLNISDEYVRIIRKFNDDNHIPFFYTYVFDDCVPKMEMAYAFWEALSMVEGIHGAARTRMDTQYRIHKLDRVCVIDAVTNVSKDLAMIFSKLCTNKWGGDSFAFSHDLYSNHDKIKWWNAVRPSKK
jgi:hypothetical protein